MAGRRYLSLTDEHYDSLNEHKNSDIIRTQLKRLTQSGFGEGEYNYETWNEQW